jgi:transposase-like protein
MNILEITKKFSTQKKCLDHLEKVRWNGEIKCVYCDSDKVCKHTEKNKERLQCWNCKKSFSVTVGTIFHHTHIELQKWFLVMSLMLNARKGASSCQIARDLGMRQPTVWSMMLRIRKAMKGSQADLLNGIVEMDETYIGGKPRKRNKDKDDNGNMPTIKRGRGTKKECVVGMIERGGKVKTILQKRLKFIDLRGIVKNNVDISKTVLMTDDFKGYIPFKGLMPHHTVNHSAKQYVVGDIHTNTIESFWAIVKRGMMGQFHWVSKKYLEKYMDEFCWRFNNKENPAMFSNLISNCVA